MLPTNTVSSPSGRSTLLRSILSLLIIHVAIPYGCNTLLKANPASDATALALAAVAPALEAMVSVLRSRHINIISLFVLGGLVVGIIATFLGGDPHVLLLRQSLFTGALGLTCFGSLFFPRPLMFLVGRSLIAGNDPEHIARYNQLWRNPYARRTSRVTTVVWGIVYCGDFLLRLLLVLTLPVTVALTIGPVFTGGLIEGPVLWTFAFLRRARQRVRTMQADSASAAGKAPSGDGRQPATVSR